ncbi:terpene cyclase/mutase family protein [soil metagenome]
MKKLIAITLCLAIIVPSFAVAPVPKDKVKLDPATKAAVDNALAFLKTKQDKEGAWGNTAITSFALLAFMSNGHVPNQGLYGPEVSKGIKYLISIARDDGYLVGPRGGNMYCHGMATLALTQAFGMTGDEDLKPVLKKAVDLIVKTQNFEGGWRYDPAPTGADISVTIMQVMALRGAKDSGLHVPDETFKKALKYISKCYDTRSGGYKYMPQAGGAGYARTAAGVCLLQLSGDYDAAELDAAVKYLEKEADDRQHFWYGHYYAAHALHVYGAKNEKNEQIWKDYYSRLKTKLLATQKPSGEWLEALERHNGSSYQTSIAVLILSVPTHFLPIYQR